ncbi:hypothetical protein BCS42_11965 [Crenothrix sp. D3]|nr:hypothetical protein BCS42_11965 [Crenothrix sp. D3]
MSEYGIYQHKLDENKLELFNQLNSIDAFIDMYSKSNISGIYERTIQRSGEDLEDLIDEELTNEIENLNSKIMHHLLYIDLFKCQNIESIFKVYPVVSKFFKNERLVFFGIFINLHTDQILLLCFRDDKPKFFAIDADKDIVVYSLNDDDIEESYIKEFCKFDQLNTIITTLNSIKSACFYIMDIEEMFDDDKEDYDRENDDFENAVIEADDELNCVKIYLPTFNECDERFDVIFTTFTNEISYLKDNYEN